MTNNPIWTAALKAAADACQWTEIIDKGDAHGHLEQVVEREAILNLPVPDLRETLAGMVRKLEWGRESPYHVARVLGGNYTIEVWDGGVTLSGTFLRGEYDTFEAAKTTAQADYAARILAGLDMGEGK